MTMEEGRKHSPPYVSYKTFEKFYQPIAAASAQPYRPQHLGGNVLRQHGYTIDVGNAVFKSD